MTQLKQFASALLIVIVVAIGAASAQSLGDYARNVRKNKAEPTSATRTFDNDNLPTGGTLSVVGPAAAADGSPAAGSRPTSSASPDKVADDRQKAADDWKAKLANQQQKVDELNKQIEKEQADSRLRAAVAASDPAGRLRNAGEWGKEDADFQNSLDQKQKALDAAREELEQMQENARKAGVREQDKDKGNQ
jgi:hypothetical protein